MALRSLSISLLTLFILVYGSIVDHDRQEPAILTWGRCPDAQQGSRFECATAEVPLDWLDSSKGKIPLSVIRLPAKSSTREGYMFFNPGGPGSPGTSFLILSGELLQADLGDGWDILSWDPRGVLQSGPDITMFASNQEYGAFLEPTRGRGTIGTRGNLTQSADVNLFMSQVSTFDNFTMEFNERMIAKNGDKLKYVGTCANVRDLVHLVDSVYGEGSDVNFWGTSYGTIMGTYLTQMFPDRVGRVILDAVLDPERHSNQSPISWMDVDYLTIDQAEYMWAQACVSNSQKCKLTKILPNTTAEDLLAGIDHMLDVAHDRYSTYVQQNNTDTGSENGYSWEVLAQSIRGSLYGEHGWVALNDILTRIAALQTGMSLNKTDGNLLKPALLRYALPTDFIDDQVGLAIFCGDTVDPSGETTEDLFKSYVKAAQRTSKFASSVVPLSMRSFCHRFTSRAVERLRQPMNKKPKNIVLVIGNTGDPFTPYGSARQLASSSQLGNKARLLQFNAPGHGADSFNSTCLTDVVRKFMRGTPPEDRGNDEADVVCEVDNTPYGPPPESWKNSTALLIPGIIGHAGRVVVNSGFAALGLLMGIILAF